MAGSEAIPLVYLDVRCLSRPVDDQSQERVADESEAVAAILRRVERGHLRWVCSDAVVLEAARTRDLAKRRYLLAATEHATEFVVIGDAESRRADQLAAWGVGWLDSLHVACAESAVASVFLTVDDVLARRLHRMGSRIAVQVRNPVDWLREVSSP